MSTKKKKGITKKKTKNKGTLEFLCEDLHGDADDAFNTVPNMAQ